MTNRNRQLEQNLIERVAIGDMLRRRARDCQHKPAIVGYDTQGRREISYQQLNAKANQLVRGLRQQGLKQGDTLALMATK